MVGSLDLFVSIGPTTRYTTQQQPSGFLLEEACSFLVGLSESAQAEEAKSRIEDLEAKAEKLEAERSIGEVSVVSVPSLFLFAVSV